MSRDLSAGVQSAIEATQVQPFLLFEGQFATDYVRVWTGYGDLTWNSQTWVGVGTFGGVSAIQESAEIQASGVSVTLSGIPSEFISLALQESRQGKSGKVYIGFLDASNDIVADPYMIFEGKLDIPSIQEEGELSTITITYESRLIDLQRPRETRFTDQEQKREYEGDRGCEFVPAMKEITLTWGRA